MKSVTTLCNAAIALFATIIPATAGIIAGPITNSDNGCEYYLLAPNSWSASEAEAENLGGTLAVVKNSAEQEWVFSTFGGYGGTHRNLWIGLRRQRQDGPFVWATGEKSDYANWSAEQPDNMGGNETSVEMLETGNPWGRTPAGWNDSSDDGSSGGGSKPCGVVEVPREKSLTKDEKSLIGIWYVGGRIDQPCYFAGTENILFGIGNYGSSARVIQTSEHQFFATGWHIHGQIVQDKILWSNGTWWSRTASNDSAPMTPWMGFQTAY